MTIDERIEFLMQSVESHDRQIGELVERMDKMAERVDTMAGRMDQTTANIDALVATVDRLTERTQLNFDRLTAVMLGLDCHRSRQANLSPLRSVIVRPPVLHGFLNLIRR